MEKESHNFHPTILREYDIRGRVGDTLSVADALALGRCFGSIILRDGGRKVSVGYDGRLSSPKLAAALTEGLLSTGIEVIDIGLGPTPMLHFSVHELKTDGGIMVTGSHNPPDYNGFKLMLGESPFFGAQIQHLGHMVANRDYEHGEGVYSAVDIAARYHRRLLKDLDDSVMECRDMKVGWDPGNGASGEVVKELIRQLPGQHFLINGDIDGTFPAHHPDPTIPENLIQLQDLIRDKQLDVGFAFDGDGDRIGVMDQNGEIVWGDQLVAIFAKEILADFPGATVIADVKASQAAFDQIDKLGGNSVMWKTGHSLIKNKISDSGALLAGEMSGHIYFKDKFYGFDDGIYAALRLLNIIAREKGGLASLLAELPKTFNTPELRFPCPESRKFNIVPEIKARLENGSCIINDIDGIRVTSPQGWWLLRPSNTQDVLVARCEAGNESDLLILMEQLNQQLSFSGIDPIQQ